MAAIEKACRRSFRATLRRCAGPKYEDVACGGCSYGRAAGTRADRRGAAELETTFAPIIEEWKAENPAGEERLQALRDILADIRSGSAGELIQPKITHRFGASTQPAGAPKDSGAPKAGGRERHHGAPVACRRRVVRVATWWRGSPWPDFLLQSIVILVDVDWAGICSTAPIIGLPGHHRLARSWLSLRRRCRPALANRGNIRIDMVGKLFGARVERALNAFGALCLLIFVALLAWQAARLRHGDQLLRRTHLGTQAGDRAGISLRQDCSSRCACRSRLFC